MSDMGLAATLELRGLSTTPVVNGGGPAVRVVLSESGEFVVVVERGGLEVVVESRMSAL